MQLNSGGVVGSRVRALRIELSRSLGTLQVYSLARFHNGLRTLK